jgi:hypothetical protein
LLEIDLGNIFRQFGKARIVENIGEAQKMLLAVGGKALAKNISLQLKLKAQRAHLVDCIQQPPDVIAAFLK